MNQNKFSIMNIVIVVYNLLAALRNSAAGYVSYMSVFILGLNLFVSIMAIKNKSNVKSETICLIIEIITAIIIIASFF